MDQAFEWLERAYEERDGILVYLNAAPFFDSLRDDDPRFQDLLLRMNLDALRWVNPSFLPLLSRLGA